MSDKLGSFVIDIEGQVLTQEDKELLAHPLVGGLILFSRNFANRDQLATLCHAARATRKTPLLIMVDQEGGRVQRFIHDFTRIPPMAKFGEMYIQQPEATLKLAKDCAWLLATELLSVSIDFSLAPVLDINKCANPAVGSRAFAPDAPTTSTLATAFMQGMQEAGMIATGKHFPGHGSVAVDSHVGIPVDERPYTALEQEDLQVFARLIKAGINGILAAHLIFPAIDDQPVGFSKRWLQDILRERLGFKGAIFSDDLNMKGADISKNYADRVATARAAGCDFALLCNNRPGVIQVLDQLPVVSNLLNREKWQGLVGKFTPDQAQFRRHPRWLSTQTQLEQFA